MGRCAKEKGILEAAIAATEVVKQHPDWRFKFILSELDKDPDYTKTVFQALNSSPSVEIQKNRTHKEVLAAYSKAAIAVIPSKWKEPFGRTALEAHFAECAVISSGTGGLSEISGSDALYVDPSSPTAIGNAICSLINEPDRLAALAKSGRKRVEQYFSISAVAQTMDHFLDQFIPAGQAD